MGLKEVLLLGLLGHVLSYDIMDYKLIFLVCQLLLKEHQSSFKKNTHHLGSNVNSVAELCCFSCENSSSDLGKN